MPVKPLKPNQLYRRCDPAGLKFRTTAELSEPNEILGQDRALEALDFGVGIRRKGYNLFVLGPSGTGRHMIARQVLNAVAAKAAPPHDWVYVNNFVQEYRPRAIRLPSGRAQALKRDVDKLLEELKSAIPATFESDEFRTRREAIDEEFKERQEQAFGALNKEAQSRGLATIRTPMGFALAPVRDNEVMPAEEFRKLPAEERQRIERDITELQKKLQEIVQRLPDLERERREKFRELTREMTRFSVASLFKGLKKAYADLPELIRHFDAMEADIIENVGLFLPTESQASADAGSSQAMALARGARANQLRRYEVNVILDGGTHAGAPVISEESPTQANLIGRIEHMAEMGALTTDFTLIKAGALHRANGGYLLIDALRLLQHPFAWEGLKRALRSGEIVIESPAQMMSMISTVSLEPEPVPLDIKVVLIGDRSIYYLLSRLDPDFDELFKVAVDFNEVFDRSAVNVRHFVRLLGGIAKDHGMRPLTSDGAARVVEQATRLTGHQGKLSAQIGRITDLLQEADYCADRAGAKTIDAAAVDRAIAAQIRRLDRIRERSHEPILDRTILIDTTGAKVGQINALAVLEVGNFAFGRPTRISARVRMGTGEVVDIERRAELGGPLHSKGVLILSSFLGARFAADHPLSLFASLVFEQSYAGVEGDSASSAELYVLLSSLAELPIKQTLAVTGSVNQHGEVQAIGGVNEKIEGFFDICRKRGLTGDQGVLIPKSNVRHLMLREDVRQAVADGRFAVYAVQTIDEGIELLTGRPAGTRRADGRWTPDSVNYLVQERLYALAKSRRRFAAIARSEAAGEPDGNDLGNRT